MVVDYEYYGIVELVPPEHFSNVRRDEDILRVIGGMLTFVWVFVRYTRLDIYAGLDI